MEESSVTTQAQDFPELARALKAAVQAEIAIDLAQITETSIHDSPGMVSGTTLRLEELPKELGVLLTSVGVLGFVLPGIAGTPALIAGGLVLWPKTFGKVEGWFSRRFPDTHRASMQQVGRFLDDLDRRYPRPELTRD